MCNIYSLKNKTRLFNLGLSTYIIEWFWVKEQQLREMTVNCMTINIEINS